MQIAGTDAQSEPPAPLADVRGAMTSLAAVAADLVGLPSSRILRVTPAGDTVVVIGTTELGRTPRPAGRAPLVLLDAATDPRTATLPAVVDGRVRGYVGCPITDDHGRLLGVLEAYGPAPLATRPDGLAVVERIAGIMGTGLDVVDEYDQIDQDRQRWQLAVEAGGVGSFDWDLVTDRLDWDHRLMELFGYGDGENFVPHIDSFTSRLHPEDVGPTEGIIAEAIGVSGRYRAEYRVVWPDGTVRWVAARGQVTRAVDGRPVRMLGVAFDVTEAHQARSMVQRTRDRLGLLAAVSSALADHREPERAVGRLASVLVPRLADYCIVSLVGEDGRMYDVGSHHPNRDLDEVLARYSRHRLKAMDPSSWALRARDTGRITVIPFPSWENIIPRLGDDIAREAIAELAPAFAICVPLRIRDEVLGVVTLFNDLETGPFGATDQQVAAEAASRAAVALDAARSFLRQRRIAEALQRSLLTAPPVVSPWQIAVRYVASVDDVQVGGDWYDAFTTPDGALVTTVGDVMGHDSMAAARMGQLRSLLRGVWLAGAPGPSRGLELVDEGMARFGVPGSATALAAVLRAGADGSVDVEASVAGHPPPLAVGGPDGARVVSVPVDPPLGVRAGRTRRTVTFSLAPGETLLAYTDGLIERRDEDIDVGLARLRAVAQQAGGVPDVLVDAVIARMTGDRGGDDVAALAVRREPAA